MRGKAITKRRVDGLKAADREYFVWSATERLRVARAADGRSLTSSNTAPAAAGRADPARDGLP